MKISDIVILTKAKLKLRKHRTIISAITISLLFGVAMALITVSSGFTSSFQKMSAELFNGKIYLIVSQSLPHYNNEQVFREAKELFNASNNPGKQYPILNTNEYTAEPRLDINNEFARLAIAEFTEQESAKNRQNLMSKLENTNGHFVSEINEWDIVGEWASVHEGFSFSGLINAINDSVLEELIFINEYDKTAIPVIISSKYAREILKLPNIQNSRENEYRQLQYIYENAPGKFFTAHINDESGSGKTVNYQIIGIIPEGNNLSMGDSKQTNVLDAALLSLANYTSFSLITPQSQTENINNEYYQKSIIPMLGVVDSVIEFQNPTEAAAFINDNNCNLIKNHCSGFYVQEFITRQVALHELAQTAGTIITYIIIFFGFLAVIIMAGTLSRIIDDERQSTAIYRSVGASKKHIRTLYMSYVLTLTAISAVFSIIISTTLSIILNSLYASNLTFTAKSIYGLVSSPESISLIGFDWKIILLIAVMFATAVLSMLLSTGKMTSKNIASDIKGI